jgi:hypothetical protein
VKNLELLSGLYFKILVYMKQVPPTIFSAAAKQICRDLSTEANLLLALLTYVYHKILHFNAFIVKYHTILIISLL